MKFDQDTAGGSNVFTGYGEGYVVVGGRRITRSVIVTGDRIDEWDVPSVAALDAARAARLLELKPEIVLLGSGTRFAFPEPAALAPLYAARIGVEVMDTRAACRTFNILSGEGRNVVAALVVD